MSDRICVICGKTNPNHHQDFCVDLGCSGRLEEELGPLKKTSHAKLPIKRMNERDFAYWLQGFFEMTESDTLSQNQVRMIKNHLDLVFETAVENCAKASLFID